MISGVAGETGSGSAVAGEAYGVAHSADSQSIVVEISSATGYTRIGLRLEIISKAIQKNKYDSLNNNLVDVGTECSIERHLGGITSVQE